MKRPAKPELPVVVLTPEQKMQVRHAEIIHSEIEALREKFAVDLKRLKGGIPKCKEHVFVLPKHAKYDWWGREWAINADVHCAICGKNGGWYCPRNPTRACEYDSGNDPLHDRCLHCGDPEERK